MINVETKNGCTKVSANGIDSELYADACIIVRALFDALNEKASLKTVAVEFKEAVTSGLVFKNDEELEKEYKKVEVKKMQRDLENLVATMRKLGIIDDNSDDDEGEENE